jgi:surface antigen
LFDSLAQRCSWAKTAMERANYEFSADLAKIDTSFVEQLLLDLVKRFKDKFIPPMGHNAAFNMPKYLHGLLSEGTKTVHGIYLYAEHASFSPGEQFENAPKIGRFLARGEFENWKPQRGRHAKITIETPLEPLARSGATGTAEVAVTTSTLPKSVTLIEKGGKIGGGAIAILGGGITAYESYQSDTYHHPGMGEGTKIARAGIKGSLSAAGGWGGAFFGAKIGAALGASLGPLGIVAGSIIGGIIGGSLAGSASSVLASGINDSILNS